MAIKSHRASCSLKFLIVGGSISGLATAYALSESGHEVIIVEKSDGRTKVSGSVRSPPNMTRILKEWPGMAALFQRRATKCSGHWFGIACSRLLPAETSERVGFMKFHEQIMSELGADFFVLQHDDLRRELTSLCSAAGVAFEYGRTVVGVKSDDGVVSIALNDGKSLIGDIVIGADGRDSIVREIVDDHLEPTHTVAGINISIPTKVVEATEHLESMCEYNELTIWMGNGLSLTGALDSSAKTFDLSVCSPMRLEFVDGDWYADHALETTLPLELLRGCDPRLQKLIQKGYTCCPTVQVVFEQDDIVGLDGTAALVGDAAHSVLIHGSHNASMAIEDAITLGRLFSRLSDRKQIPLLLDAYREIRHPRTRATQESEYQSLVNISEPSGPLRDVRDGGLKATLSKEFEDFHNCEASALLVQSWEQYLVLFSHDANEEVDNWWSMWGSVVEALG
ncbi:hypothetical protein B0H15DRAFT_772207 [Mycena belliarum]|uniref:FAD-binding domain-containing protein n=1 Tax=Mycena belliarum TaxID=1033014 RepID=A0AAD6UCG0_9AGAR|nr:hypothetical protein B0H15DRAFT_772207 [Mycena belliae]